VSLRLDGPACYSSEQQDEEAQVAVQGSQGCAADVLRVLTGRGDAHDSCADVVF
jgi:hypothetical protein